MSDRLRCPTCETDTLALWMKSWDMTTLEPDKTYRCETCYATWTVIDAEGDFTMANQLAASRLLTRWEIEETYRKSGVEPPYPLF